MDLTKKYIYVNPDDTAGEVDGSRLFPVSSLNRFQNVGDASSLLLAFEDPTSDDVTVVDITITENKGKEVGEALIEEINFGKEPVIVLADKSNNEKFHQDIDLGTAPVITEGAAGTNTARVTDAHLRMGKTTQIQSEDGSFAARAWDDEDTHTDTDLTSVNGGAGLAVKKPVFNASADAGDLAITLTKEESGSVIACDADTNNIVFTLPLCNSAGDVGTSYTFVCTTAVNASKTIIVKTNGAGSDNNDTFLMYAFQGATSATDVDGDTLTIPNSATIGTTVEIVLVKGGAAEHWLAKVYSPQTITVADS